MTITTLSMTKIKEETVPQELLDQVGGLAYDGWVGDNFDGSLSTKYACIYEVEGILTVYFVFGKGKFDSVGTDNADSAFKFRALFVIDRSNGKCYVRYFEPIDIDQILWKVIHAKTASLIKDLGLEETDIASPLNCVYLSGEEK